MKDEDRQIVEAGEAFGQSDLTDDLVLLVKRLDKQLTEVVEAVEPFIEAEKQIGAHYPDFYGITVIHPKEGIEGWGIILCLKIGDFRRLAQALKEMKG